MKIFCPVSVIIKNLPEILVVFNGYAIKLDPKRLFRNHISERYLYKIYFSISKKDTIIFGQAFIKGYHILWGGE